MGFRLRKRIKLLPGLWLNLSKTGVSTSIGGKGVTVNIKDGKTKTTIGIPGTGISYSEATPKPHEAQKPQRATIPAWVWVLLFVVVMAAIMPHGA